jgi:4-amino-4-deoxy-L-arabinose transferase-like glycosyltransferase
MANRAEGVAPRVVLLLAAAVLLGVGIPYLQLPFAGEHGVYAFGGWRMRQGEVPYRDFWDMNTPAAFAMHAIADALFGHRMSSIRIFDLLWMLATSIFLYRVARRLFGPLAASLAILFATATYFMLGHQPTAQRDGWCLLPLLMMMDGVARCPPHPVATVAPLCWSVSPAPWPSG